MEPRFSEPLYLDFEQAETERRLQEAQAIEDATHIGKLLESKGWEVAEKWLFQQINLCKEKLVDEQDEKQIFRLQQAVRCYSNVIGFLHSQLNLGKSLQQTREQPPE